MAASGVTSLGMEDRETLIPDESYSSGIVGRGATWTYRFNDQPFENENSSWETPCAASSKT